jgi:hypothetical protein
MPSKKKTVKKKGAAKKNKVASEKKAVPKKAGAMRSAEIAIAATDLIIELCAPGKRCKQKPNGHFIRQHFRSGRWQQASGTQYPTLEACKAACEEA